ncbi:MAG: HD-GYP domain-containing protein [Hahellaceae bacterium]|nr:HD-GYP domain-containing protein [Hahellaceae bacterium]MCP5169388.1 HD-GYP domain-containing protein [Hahellaceae bacterium]
MQNKNDHSGKPKTNKESLGTRLIEVKLRPDQLELGMHVTRTNRPWTELPVMFQGMTITSHDDIDMLREHCREVYIEIDKEFWLETRTGIRSEEQQYPGLREKVPFREELPRAQFVLQDAKAHVEKVLDAVEKEQVIEIEQSRALIKSCVDSILSNANALLWLTKIKDQDKYTAEHCIRVGILAIAFGRFIGLEKAELELLGMCGILHDVGKMKVPNDILNKPGRLTRIEYDIMKQHTSFGYDILCEYKSLEPMVKDTARFHHERVDGQGYPRGLQGAYLHKYIRMVTIVDAYDAITSSRIYKSGSPAFDALKILFAERGKHFDDHLVEAFIQMVGIYPPGTLVEMTNGEVGIVVSANPSYRLRPKVELVMTSDKKMRSPYIINLAENILDGEGKVYSIKAGLANGTHGVDVKNFTGNAV